MTEIPYHNAHFVTSQRLPNISKEEWDTITIQKNSFILSDTCGIDFLKFPGFVFSTIEAKYCYDRIYKQFIQSNAYTFSRGNLSKNNTYIFMGIRPGHVLAELSKADTAWLFGPSSIMLHKLLEELKIYPYFTNVYNDYRKPFDKDFNFIIRELLVVAFIYKVIYSINKLTIIFMGNYEEYNLLENQIVNNNRFNKLSIEFDFKYIWHPAYLARSFTLNKFNQWKEQL